MKPFEIASKMPQNDSRGSKTNDQNQILEITLITVSIYKIIIIVIIILGWE